MKRELDATGYTQYLAIGAVILLLLLGFLAFMVQSRSESWEGSDSSDDWNPITKNLYIDTEADLTSGTDAGVSNPSFSAETKRLNLELKNFETFPSYNGDVTCTLYLDGNKITSASEEVEIEETLSGYEITPNGVDFSFGPIEREFDGESIELRIVYTLEVPDDVAMSGNTVEVEGSLE